ncbi:disintegrin and metalloproteinase domain-containing protein 33 [Spea bombifrons]|uniref:disintegrin and metalloproteinase domain-containing protein 33 n=1 Tax=Spea bombifrons TaxID=233779 RepID=UPI00234B3310|nr:disintegrin and metalloproteinase domain-containing protein 33 [Spea bombifrons]
MKTFLPYLLCTATHLPYLLCAATHLPYLLCTATHLPYLLCTATFLRLHLPAQAVPSAKFQDPDPTPNHLLLVRRIRSEPGAGGSREQQGKSENAIEFVLRIGQRDHLLTLRKAQDLLAPDFTAFHYHEDGTLVSESPGHLAHCCYTGTADGLPESSASLCVCQGLSGSIRLGDEIYTSEGISSESGEYLMSKQLPPSTEPVTPKRERRFLQGPHRQARQQRYNVELFLVADKAEFQRHGEDLERTRHHLMAMAHHLNQIFLKINVQIFLVGTEIWTHENKANVSEKASSTLLQVLEWRRRVLLPRKHHDNLQLVSGMRFQNHALGEAFLGKMCSPSHSGGVIKDTGLSPRELAKYVAHEMGHNLGMYHDTETCYCPAASGKCLLSRRTGYNMDEVFSDCSHRFLDRFLEEKDITCLKDRPQIYMDEPIKQSHPSRALETVGKVSLILCCLVILLLVSMIVRSRLCQKQGKETKMAFSPVQTLDGHQSAII